MQNLQERCKWCYKISTARVAFNVFLKSYFLFQGWQRWTFHVSALFIMQLVLSRHHFKRP